MNFFPFEIASILQLLCLPPAVLVVTFFFFSVLVLSTRDEVSTSLYVTCVREKELLNNALIFSLGLVNLWHWIFYRSLCHQYTESPSLSRSRLTVNAGFKWPVDTFFVTETESV